MIPGTARAEETATVIYRETGWSGAQSVTHGDAVAEGAVVLNAETTKWLDGKTYVARSGSLRMSSRIMIEPNTEVNLILCDGTTLVAEQGIEACFATLNIYGQCRGTGRLVATGLEGKAGIGGGNGGSVVIHGGVIEARGGAGAAGIGGGGPSGCFGGPVVVFGGAVTATGGENAAGIGGGNGGTVWICGGTVMATGGARAAGIGGGNGAIGDTTVIDGGTVIAKGGASAAGIGGGAGGSCETVTINGGAVTASGGEGADGIGRGGDGEYARALTLGESVKLYGGADENPTTLLATGDCEYADARFRCMRTSSPHVHYFSYSASGASVTATCSESGCPITEGLTITICAPEAPSYDGSPKEATLSDGYDITAFPDEYIISYRRATGERVWKPVDAGEYVAEFTIGYGCDEATASVGYTIGRATPEIVSPPEASDITEGQRLSASRLVGGTASVGGEFSWGDGSVRPALSDSDTTEYEVVFTPYDTANYNTATCKVKVAVNKAKSSTGRNSPSKGVVLMSRLYNPNSGEHFYTASAGERDLLVNLGWVDEGVGWYSDAAGGVAVWRQYNPNASTGSHNFTTSTGERDLLVGLGWSDEGIAWYGAA